MNRLQSNEVPGPLGWVSWEGGRGDVEKSQLGPLAHQSAPQIYFLFYSGHCGCRFIAKR